jgi:hypothetical protein
MKNRKFKALSRYKTFGFDGRYSGPVNSASCGDRVTVVEILMHLLATSGTQQTENSDEKC